MKKNTILEQARIIANRGKEIDLEQAESLLWIT